MKYRHKSSRPAKLAQTSAAARQSNAPQSSLPRSNRLWAITQRLSLSRTMLFMALVLVVMYSFFKISMAAAPNPGHTWAEIDDTDLTVSQGGTGASTLTANNVILGNGTSAVTFVAPGTSGYVLTSNGTTWTSAASKQMIAGAASASLSADAVCDPFGNVCSGTLTTAIGARMPYAGTISNLYAYIATAPSGHSCIYTVRKSSTCVASSYSSTALTCTVTTGNTLCADTSNSASVSAGDCLQILFDESTACSGTIGWGFQYTPS